MTIITIYIYIFFWVRCENLEKGGYLGRDLNKKVSPQMATTPPKNNKI